MDQRRWHGSCCPERVARRLQQLAGRVWAPYDQRHQEVWPCRLGALCLGYYAAACAPAGTQRAVINSDSAHGQVQLQHMTGAGNV